MPNLRSNSEAQMMPGGFVSSRVGVSAGSQSTPVSTAFMTNTQDTRENLDHANWAVSGGMHIAAAPVDILDSLAANFPQVQRGDLNASVYKSVGLPGYATWVQNHQEGVEVASGLLGAAAIGIGTEAVLGRVLGSAWFGATGLGRVANGVTERVGMAQAAARAATREAAAAGNALGWMNGANGVYVGQRALMGGLRAATSEVAIAASLNQNSFIWTDDMNQNLLFGALGVGIGAAGGAIMGRAAVNRYANSPEVAAINASVRDPGEYEKLMAEDVSKVLGVKVNESINYAPKPSTLFTNQMLNARRAEAGGITSLRAETKTQLEHEAARTLQVMTSRGAYGLPDTGFNAAKSSAGDHIRKAASADPTLLFGAGDIGRLTDEGALAAVEKRATWVSKKLKNKKLAQADRLSLERVQQQQPLVLINGAWVSPKEADSFTGYLPGKTVAARSTRGTGVLETQTPFSGKVTIREDGMLNKPWIDMSTADQMTVRDMANQQMITRKGERLIVPKNADFMTLHYAIEFEKRGGTVDFLTKAGLKDAKDAEMAALRQKANLLMNANELTMQDRIKYNLPLASSAEKVSDPDSLATLTWVKAASDPKATYDEVLALRKKVGDMVDLVDDQAQATRLDGDIFNFNLDSKGRWQESAIAFFDSVKPNNWTKSTLGDMAVEAKALQVRQLKSSTKSPLVKAITESVYTQEIGGKLLNVARLADNQIGGTQSYAGAVGANVLTKGHLHRNSEMLLAAQDAVRLANRITEQQLDEVFQGLQDHMNHMASKSGQKSKLLYNQYASYSKGWDIAEAVEQGDGFWAFRLDPKSQNNVDRLGRKLTDSDLLTAPNGHLVVLDETSNNLRAQLEKAYKRMLGEKNTLRESQGLTPIKLRPFYTAPASTSNKFIAFTLDSSNRVVPGGAVIADTAAARAKQMEALQPRLKEGERLVTKESVESKLDLWDMAGMDFFDPAHAAAPSGQQKGGLAGSTINPRALEDSLDFIKHQFESIKSGTMRSLFDNQLRSARVYSAAQTKTLGTPKGTKNIYDTFAETLMGIPSRNSPTGLSPILSGVDSAIDQIIETVWPLGNVPATYLSDVFDKLGDRVKGINRGSISSFEKLASELGPYMPFADAVQQLEYKHGVQAPWKARNLSQAVNRLGAGVILRWLEIPHAAMNLAGIVTNMPGILQASNLPTIGKVGGVNVVDSYKILARGGKRMLTERSTEDWKWMVKNGDASQDIAEMHMQMAMLRGKSGFMRFLEGDGKYSNWKSIEDPVKRRIAQLRFKGVEGIASVMTDTSENMSRQWAHFVGLELADLHGITGMEARHSFARKIANEAIANYDPLNRPEVYQSAFGSMYGLFLSYAQNYYEKMFRWLEVGDFKALGHSMASQAAMFGFTGVPGAQQLATLMGGEEEGEDMMTGIYERFGPAVGSVVAQGGFNQITTIFNLPAVSMNSRGDVNFRHPALDFASTGITPLPVGLEAIKDAVSGIFDAASKMVNPNVPQSTRYMTEALARNMPSRAMKGALGVLLNDGQEVDQYGNVMTETQNMAETVYRILGIRSARQQAELEAYFLNRRTQDIEAAKLADVREASRSMIRAGEYDKLPQVFEKYVEAGGNPQNYPAWIRRLIKESSNSRGQNQLNQSLKSPDSQLLARRMELFTSAY